MTFYNEKDCVECGKPFRLFKSTDKFCSFQCVHINNNKQKKDKAETTKVLKSQLGDVYVGINDRLVRTEKQLFEQLWEERPRKSFLTNRPITIKKDSDMWANIFAHVLAKGKAKYPRFKLYSENIIFLTPEEHHLLDQGTEAQREKYALMKGCNWDKVYTKREYLKGKYNRLFP